MKATRILVLSALLLLLAVPGLRAQDKVSINNNTGATLVGLFMSLNDLKNGDPDWEHNLIHGHPLQKGEVIDVQAFEGEHCETYVIGIAANGDWWYVEQDTCKNHKVDLAETTKGEGHKKTE